MSEGRSAGVSRASSPARQPARRTSELDVRRAGPAGTSAPAIRATLIGIVAPGLWATIPLLATFTQAIPPLQLMSFAFGLAFMAAVARWVVRGDRIAGHFRQPMLAWVIGVYGIFGWHFCYFLAVRHAPVAEASLINHTWPLLIVVFSSLLPGERLRWWHGVGAVAGLAGTVLLVTDGSSLTLKMQHAFGYALAAACALIWSTYSLLNRRFAGAVSTEAVGTYCGAAAALALLGHVLLEPTVWPIGWSWLAILALGVGPLGVAFFAWDYGTKHGDIRVLGTASYFTPLLAAGLLVAAGRTDATWTLLAACVLITGGAAIAAADLLSGARRAGSSPRRCQLDT